MLNKETMLTKESVLNKENTVLINGMKSLEKRKAVGSLARKLGRLTSTGNLAKKSMKGN